MQWEWKLLNFGNGSSAVAVGAVAVVFGNRLVFVFFLGEGGRG